MFKIIKSSTYETLLADKASSAEALRRTESVMLEQSEVTRNLETKADALTQELQSVLDAFNEFKKKTTESETNYVRIDISNDLKTVTPVIGVRPDCFECLFQEGLVDDTQEGNQFAVQLALLSVAEEALSQIIESFEPAVE